jgi:hypothetical protein
MFVTGSGTVHGDTLDSVTVNSSTANFTVYHGDGSQLTGLQPLRTCLESSRTRLAKSEAGGVTVLKVKLFCKSLARFFQT